MMSSAQHVSFLLHRGKYLFNLRKNGIYQITYTDSFKGTNVGGSEFKMNIYNRRLNLISSERVFYLSYQKDYTTFTFVNIFNLTSDDYFNFSSTNGV